MAYDLIPILLLLGCVAGIAVIVGRKLPRLKTLNVESIPAERELRLKQRLLATRLRRRLQAMWRAMAALARPVVRRLAQRIKGLSQRMQELEAKYRRPASPTAALPTPEELSAILAAADQLQAQGERGKAEDTLMQAVQHDPRHVGAYERLGALYLEAREYVKARDVYSYLVKLLRRHPPAGNNVKARAAGYHLNLATAYLELGRKAQALQAARKAVGLDPNNPRLLDCLLKISILVKDKALAETTWRALRLTDPDNAKLDELRTQIDQLS